MIRPMRIVFTKQHCKGVDVGAFTRVGSRRVRGSAQSGATGVKVIARARSGYRAAEPAHCNPPISDRAVGLGLHNCGVSALGFVEIQRM